MENLEENILSDQNSLVGKKNNSWKRLYIKYLVAFLASLLLAFFYMWIYVSVFDFELPKTIILKSINNKWKSKINSMDARLTKYDEVLSSFQLRDDDVYRSIFGLNPIPGEIRNEGFGGMERYLWIEKSISSGYLTKNTSSNLKKGASEYLKEVYMELDILTKKTYIQSMSFEEIRLLAKKAGNMASCIPAMIPVVPDKGKYRISSSFGYRRDPFTGRLKYHSGMDFALDVGQPIFATGDGVVQMTQSIVYGYGKNLMIDHGFGYETRYAHLSEMYVKKGDVVKRGDVIGLSGNSGRSSGPHLHYEVRYRKNHVNPYNYMDLSLEMTEFSEMTDDFSNSDDSLDE